MIEIYSNAGRVRACLLPPCLENVSDVIHRSCIIGVVLAWNMNVRFTVSKINKQTTTTNSQSCMLTKSSNISGESLGNSWKVGEIYSWDIQNNETSP